MPLFNWKLISFMAVTWFSLCAVTFYMYDISEHNAIEFNNWDSPRTVFCSCLILITLEQLLQLFCFVLIWQCPFRKPQAVAALFVASSISTTEQPDTLFFRLRTISAILFPLRVSGLTGPSSGGLNCTSSLWYSPPLQMSLLCGR